MAFGGVLLFNFFLMIVLVAALFGGISIIAAAVMGITHFIHKKTGKPTKKLSCKLNNLDLFVKMPKPPLWTAFGYV